MIIVQIANALALASLLTLLASGLALMYGLRNVMNFSHGAMYMIGAYLGYTVSGYLNFWAALVVVPMLLALIGAAFEYIVIRPLHHRPHLDLALLTFGLSLIITQTIVLAYGGAAHQVLVPDALSGSIDLYGSLYPVYRIFLIGFGLGTCLLLAVWLRWTRSGLHVRAVSQSPDVARMMGVNSDRLSLLVVCLSAAFAGFAGVLAGPYLSVEPGMGQTILISCLIVVVVGGVGSIGGAVVAAILYGFIQVIGAVIFPSFAVLLPYVLLAVVLLWRPQGLGRGRA